MPPAVTAGRKLPRPAFASRLRARLAGVVALALVAVLLSACRGAAAPTEDPPAAHLRLVPCGGTARLQQLGSSEWVVADTQILIDGEIRLAADGVERARLCPGDGSLLELGPDSAIDVRPAENGSRLEIALQEGSLLILAQGPSYQVATSACSVRVRDVPARIQVERREGTTHLMVEEGSAVCASGPEPSLLPTCWELVAGPEGEPQIARYCGARAEASATEPATATSTIAPTPAATAAETTVGAPSPSPSPPPQPTSPPSTPTPEPTPIP
jgi:ferric-dicitrate binding protein FerR (iron transport regulator)